MSGGGKKRRKMSIEDCIRVLESIKARGKDSPEIYSHYTKEYCEKLAEVEALAIDTVISILRDPG